MSDLFIRRYQSSDKNEVKDLYKLASIHSEIGYRSGPWESDFDRIEDTYLTDGEFLVGLLDSHIVAIGGYIKITNAIGQIRRMRVHPDFRRNGYASQLLQELEKIARRSGFQQLRLKTSKQQKMAQSFYEKNGFKKMKAKKEFYSEGGGNSFEVVWYKKEIEN